MAKTVLKIENVSKLYRLGEIGTGTLSHDLNRWWHRMRGKEDPYQQIGTINQRDQKGDTEYVWALKDINLEIKQGEVLGIIGANGAGKSTLLKILSKVTAPTTGRIRGKGRISALLEVGTGFHPELTARENIYLNGTILGMHRQEITQQLDAIVDFAGVERYLDTPVKRYSSGMRVRLGFAVAAFLQTDILIIDEVLAVGDAEFQNKAIGKMQDISTKKGRTVLFVSHNMASIKRLCNRGILLKDGIIKYNENITKTVNYYLSNINSNSSKVGEKKWNLSDPYGKDILRLLAIRLINENGEISATFKAEEKIQFELEYFINEDVIDMRFNFQIRTKEDYILFSSSTHNKESYRKKKGKYICTTSLPNNFFNEGKYNIYLQAGIPNIRQLIKTESFLEFKVLKFNSTGTNLESFLPGFTSPDLDWKIKKID